YSPTSRPGTRSPSSPGGSVEQPVSPALFALGAGARFVARAIDTLQKHLVEVLKQAHAHRGASFVEIFQNCIVYNDEVFAGFTAKSVAQEAQIHVEHGRPLAFAGGRRGLRLAPGKLDLQAVRLGEDGVTEADILIHDEANRTLATMLAAMQPPALPMALGVLYRNPGSSLDTSLHAADGRQNALPSCEDLNALLRRGDTWTVAG
ncbi:MAG: 2-oxoacid:ferredoxin oxidoreductase subunit beta, partial [Bacteroidota bacterium]